MGYQATKSSYGNNNQMPQGEKKESKTTHYAYTLYRDENGKVDRSKGQNGKEYVNSLQIFENDGEYGKYLKIRVTGPVPADDIFVQRKKGK
jgi:hypothetical protein